MNEELRKMIDEFEEAFALAYGLREEIEEYIEEHTNIDRCEIAEQISTDDFVIFEIDQDKLSELIKQNGKGN